MREVLDAINKHDRTFVARLCIAAARSPAMPVDDAFWRLRDAASFASVTAMRQPAIRPEATPEPTAQPDATSPDPGFGRRASRR